MLNRNHLAAGDINQDGLAEVVAVAASLHLVVYDGSGALLAQTQETVQADASFSGLALANLDGQGPPEIIHGARAWRWENGALTQLLAGDLPAAYPAAVAVADVDLDGAPDIVSGNRIYDGQSGADKTPASVASLAAGFPAVVQWDASTPEPEVVLSTSGSGVGLLYLYHPVSGEIVFGPVSTSSQAGGAPIVADFDGDGEPEIGVPGLEWYSVFDRDCLAEPLPDFCQEAGVRWRKTIRDSSSGITGSSVFDFNGDGAAEVVFRDECWLRIYDGSSGAVRLAVGMSSKTATEMPIVADVDNDGHADIVTTADPGHGGCPGEADLGLPAAPANSGLYVLRDPANKWRPSRPIWNQYTYHITNINDDGSIPLHEQNNWESWNNYRQNSQGMVEKEIPGVDLTARWHNQVDSATDCAQVWVLMAEICNRGPGNAPAVVSGTFYLGDPANEGQAICSALSQQAPEPGDCEVVACTWENPPEGEVDLWFVADEEEQALECHEGNNGMHLEAIVCPGILE